MNIQNALRKLLHKPAREQPNISRKADQFYSVLLERGDNLAIVLLPQLAFRWNDDRVQPPLSCGSNSGCVRLVGDDDCDSGIRNAARIYAVRDSDEVRPASGEENAERFHSGEHHNSPRRHGSTEKNKGK